MNRIPVDTTRLGSLALLSAEPAMRDGQPDTTQDGTPKVSVQVLVQPPVRPDGSTPRASVEIVKVATRENISMPPMTPVAFDDLVAFAWEMGGRSGISLSATGVREMD